jgi:hypothetical protein
MASITFWNRIEPRPRSASLARALGARVRDPLWFLTRQWQFGEFQGEDAASPAYVQIVTRCSRIESWNVDGEDPHQLGDPPEAPLEALAMREPVTPDLATSVELGQRFEQLLAEAGLVGPALAAVRDDFRGAYPLPSGSDPASGAEDDPAVASFLRVCAGRALDGVTLRAAYLATRPALPAAPAVDPSNAPAVRVALEWLLEWAIDVYGELGRGDPPGWRPDRLEYEIRAAATAPDGRSVRLAAYPGRSGELDWYSFDEIESSGGAEGEEKEPVTQSLLPVHVRFRGMPNARFWQLERGTTNLSEVKADRSELAKLVVVDFMLVHGNDWFVAPLPQTVGTLCRVDAVLVHDVFGEVTLVPPANDGEGAERGRWSLFAIRKTGARESAGYLILPPSAPSATQHGERVEEVRFLRDETFNSAWAVEHTTENGIARPWSGHERAQRSPAEPEVNDTASPLRYLVQSAVPLNWIPFVPVAQADGRAIAFQRAAMLRRSEDGSLAPVEPVGRILRPERLENANVYRVREEEIPRTGVRVSRIVRRARWIDGTTRLWWARVKGPGAGEGSSGLRFDLAIPKGAGQAHED